MRILIIDDETVNIELIESCLKSEGYETISCLNGNDGLKELYNDTTISLILLDRTMPVMDGMLFMQKFKKEPRFNNIPVIMQTAVADSDSIAEGLNAGVYYYLTKPYKKAVLLSVVNAALVDANHKKELLDEMRKNRKMLGFINQAWFEIRTMEEALNLAYFVAGSFPNPDKAILGLSEMIINAVEHGNLGIGYYEKSDLLLNGRLHNEISSRQAQPKYREKKVNVIFEKNKQEITVTIKDEGNGFDWRKYMEIDPARITDPNGRGIVMAKMMSFDNIQYNEKGNEVCCKLKI